MRKSALLAAPFALLLSAIASDASDADTTFDCGKATHEIELLICGDQELGARDRVLARIYARALETLEGKADEKEATELLSAGQRGWIGGREECWKSEDRRQCTLDAYARRTAELQARYDLAPVINTVRYACGDETVNGIVATFYQTDPPAARLERGDDQFVAIQGMSASGARYEGPFGIVFWIKGEDASVEWPQGTQFECKVVK